ncbi:hypothetical protein MNBD_ACTINO01-85 [hydrothermal vent metagenome]|uniref:Uncharacterized protein n=1 Tax=hydrothermal vent metagenome TaxID=652676 RepID=A0A3B0SNX4_9ZZZZ
MIHRHDIPPLDRKITRDGSSASALPVPIRHTMATVDGDEIIIMDASGYRVVQ